MNKLKCYWATESGSDWKMLVFANNPTEAKSLFRKHSPTIDTVEWIHIRVWQADQKWMKFYEGSDVIISMPEMTDKTWEGWYSRWEAKQ